MKRLFLIFFPLAIASCACGQARVNAQSRLLFQKVPYGLVSELPPAPPATVGTAFYDEQWQPTTIYLTDNTRLDGLRARLNIRDHVFEIQHENTTRLLPGTRVHAFEWKDESGKEALFLNAQRFFRAFSRHAFLKVLDSGVFTLYEETRVELLPATYNIALDVGSKDNQLTKESHYYIASGEKLVEVTYAKRKFSKDFRAAFGTDIAPALRQHDIRLKDESDLIRLINFLNKGSEGVVNP